MNKKTIILIVILLAVLAVAYLIVSRPQKESTLNDAETSFTVQDTAAVTKVFISNRDGKNNLLQRGEGNKWIVNNKYPANPTMVNLLLSTMQQMQVRRPVSKQARNTVIRTLATLGTKVEVYTKDGLLKTFYVGGNSQDEKGSHFLMEGSENPYVLHIRGFEGYLSSRFKLAEKDWRSKQVFASLPPTIQEINLAYNDSPATSITVRQVKNRFVLQDAPNQDSTSVKFFVSQFKNLHAEDYIMDPPQKFIDSLSFITPRAVLTLKDANPEKSQKLVIYPNPADPNRMVARFGQKSEHLGTIQRQAFETVLIRKNQLLQRLKTNK